MWVMVPLSRRSWPLWLCIVLLILVVSCISPTVSQNVAETATDDAMQQQLEHPHADSCSWTGGSCEWDYNMQPMTALFENNRKEIFYAYMEPDVSTFYNQSEGQLQVVPTEFKGMFAKFVNMSPKAVRIMWYVSHTLEHCQNVYVCR